LGDQVPALPRATFSVSRTKADLQAILGLNDQWVPLVTMDYSLLKNNGIAYRELCLTSLMIDSNMINSSAYTVSLGSKGTSRPCTKVFAQDT
jgi:hypothetical protein